MKKFFIRIIAFFISAAIAFLFFTFFAGLLMDAQGVDSDIRNQIGSKIKTAEHFIDSFRASKSRDETENFNQDIHPEMQKKFAYFLKHKPSAVWAVNFASPVL